MSGRTRSRADRLAAGPVSRGKPCDWCLCSDCQGVPSEMQHHLQSILLADGTRMCDVCWLYPPCDGSNDCETYQATGECDHRPKKQPGAFWLAFDALLEKTSPQDSRG